MASFATGTDQKGIVLQNLIEGGAPAIWADQGVVAQTLDAIVGNIIRFSDDQGLVTLEYLQEPDGDTEHVLLPAARWALGLPTHSHKAICTRHAGMPTLERT